MAEPTQPDPQSVIEGEVVSALAQQKELEDIESALMQNEQFKQFMSLRDAVNKKWDEVRSQIEAVMVPAYKEGKIDKSIKRGWGSITVKENDEFEIDQDILPKKFWKKVPDTSFIRSTFQLEGKEVKGTKHSKKYSIVMKFKKESK